MGQKTDIALAEGNFATDSAAFIHDLVPFLKGKQSAADYKQLAADSVKVVNDVFAVTAELILKPIAESAAKKFSALAIAADYTDAKLKIAALNSVDPSEEGVVTASNAVGLAADVVDMAANLLIIIPIPVTEGFGLALKVASWALGTASIICADMAKDGTGLAKAEIHPAADGGPTDPVTISGSDIDSGLTVTADSGAQLVTSPGPADQLPESDTWTDPVGTTGQDAQNSDGSIASTINYANGAKAKEFTDVAGNILIDYYNAAGNLTSASWSYADGSSGNTQFYNNSKYTYGSDVDPLVAAMTSADADGSYQVMSVDADDNETLTKFNSSGVQVSQNVSHDNATNFDSDPVIVQSTNYGTATYDAETGDIVAIHDVYTAVSVQHVVSIDEQINASGSITGKIVKFDGSWQTYSEYGSPSGSGLTSNIPAFDQTIRISDLKSRGSDDETINDYDNQGNLTGSDWALYDGENGSYTFDNGSGSGTINRAGGGVSSLSVDSQGNISVAVLDANGHIETSDWWHSDGTHGVDLYKNGSVVSRYSYQANGQLDITDELSGNVSTFNAGAVVSPDGNSFAKVANADGGYTIGYLDYNGDASLFDFDGSGVLKGTDQVSASRAPIIDNGFSTTLDDGSTQFSPYNPKSAVITSADGSSITPFFDNTGKEVGNDWVGADGSTGTNTFYSDGSSSGTSLNADGTSTTYDEEADGSSTHELFNADGTEKADAWTEADGTSGNDNYADDGSSAGAQTNPDGTSFTYHEDAAGDIAYIDYSADGKKVDTEYENADGSYGRTDFNADGSTSSRNVATDGRYQTVEVDAVGDQNVEYWSAGGKELSSSWTSIDGRHGSATYQPDGSSDSVDYGADGSRTVMHDDAQGNVSTTDYDASGQLTSNTYKDTAGSSRTVDYTNGKLSGDDWTKADGSSGSDTFSADGSSGSIVLHRDGSRSETSTDEAGNATTVQYNAAGVKVSDVWEHADGSSGSDQFTPDGNADTRTTFQGGLKTVETDDGAGNLSSLTTDSGGVVVSGSWRKADGSHGTEATIDGTETDLSFGADGSCTKTVRDQAGNTSWTTVDSGGAPTSSAYANADGSYGDTTFEADGTTLTRNHHRDGSYDEVTAAVSGDSRTVYFSASGVELSETSVISGVTTTISAGVASAVSNFEKDGVFARAGGQGDGYRVVGLYTASGTELTAYGNYSPDLNAGYGGPPDYRTLGINQSTFLGNGVIEQQDPYPQGGGADVQVGSAYALVDEVSTVTNSRTLPTFHGIEGGQVASMTTSSPPPAPVTPAMLVITPLDGSRVGIGLATDGGPPLYIYDNNSVAKYDLSGNLEPVAVATISSLSAAMSYVAKSINTESASIAYVNGSTFSYTTGSLYGEIDDSVSTDTAGDYQHYHLDESTLVQTWVGHNAAGETYSATDNSTVIRYADGRIAESDSGVSYQYESQYDVVNGPFGNTLSTRVSGDSAEDISVDSLGDVIKSDFSAVGSYGTESVNTSWTEADGTTVSAAIDLTTGAGNERLGYTDGSYTVLQNDAVGNSVGIDYSAQGVSVGREWAHADGASGSNSTTADGNYLDKWTNADGSHGSQVTDAVTGEVIGSSVNANGSAQSSWDNVSLANGQVESTSKDYNADGTVTSYDTLTQADGSYSQTWTSTDGTFGTYDLDAATGEITGTSSDGQGNTSSTDKTQLGAGVVESKATVNDADGSQTLFDTIAQPSGSYTQRWSRSDGSTGTNTLDAASGETSGSKVTADGSETDTWDNITYADGSQEAITTTLHGDGTGISYDTVTQADGSYDQSWSSLDGSSGTGTLDAATGETTGSTSTAGSGVVVSWDRLTLSSGAVAQTATYAYDDGSSLAVDSTTYVDGASGQAWRKSDGETGSNFVGVQSETGDTFDWDASTHYGTLQTVDGNDSLTVSAGVSADQLWFNRGGDDLYLSVVGSDSYLDVQGWYAGTSSQLKSIELSNGQTLDRSDVQKLVDAMAGFAPPGFAQSQYTPQERTVLTPVLASSWH